MFKNLRTGTTLVVLCGVFIAAIGATTYSLVAEKLISIEFARKELIGSRYLATVREIYVTVLGRQPFVAAAPPTIGSTDNVLKALATAQGNAGAVLQTNEIAQALAEMLGLWSRNSESGVGYGLEVLAKARQLASRIADDLNLALDPDLDSYHVQDLVTRKLPAFLDVGRDAGVVSRGIRRPNSSGEQKLHIQILDPLLRSTTDEMGATLAGAFRGDPDGSRSKPSMAPLQP